MVIFDLIPPAIPSGGMIQYRLTPVPPGAVRERREAFTYASSRAGEHPGARIQLLRKRAKMSQEQLALEVGVSQSIVSRWERKKDRPAPEHVERLAAIFGVQAGWIMFGSQDAAPRYVPVYGYVGAGAELIPFDDHADNGGLEQVEAPYGVPDDAVAVRVRGDSQYPEMTDGDILIYRRDVDFDEAACIGKRCVVRLTDGRVMVKRLRRGSEAGAFTLESVNAPPLENVQLDWAAPIRWIQYR